MNTNLVLVGNANTGKTTLFNAFTKQNQKTGNWHGVTNTVAKSNYTFNQTEFTLYDIPGIYSLTPLSFEEKVATKDYFTIVQDISGYSQFATYVEPLIILERDIKDLYLGMNKYINSEKRIEAVKKFNEKYSDYNKTLNYLFQKRGYSKNDN